MYIYTKLCDFINEKSYTSFDKDDDILPKEILDKLKTKLGIKRFTRIASGKYGTAFRISNTKVLKITKDLKEYEYAKLIEGKKNVHIADVYKTYYFEFDGTKYAIIIKEYCNIDEEYFYNVIDSFLDYTEQKEKALWYVSYEFLMDEIDKKSLESYFKKYDSNGGLYINWMEQWYGMLLELKSKNICIGDFNGSNVGIKPTSGKLCVIELGLGRWSVNINYDKNDYIEI